MRLVTGISIVSLIVSVATLALVLMLFMERPWESAMTEADVRGVIQSESSKESRISEAERLETCKVLGDVIREARAASYSLSPKSQANVKRVENRCTLEELYEQ